MSLRMRSVIGGRVACCLILACTSGAYSQAQVREETRTTTTTQVRRLSLVIEASVQLQAGATFGKVDDIVINDQGCIDFVVLVFEEKLIAVPFSLVEVDFARKVVRVDVERERLLKAPSFARARFPDLSVNSDFGRRVNTFFRVQSEPRPQEGRPQDKRPPEQRKPVEKDKPKKDAGPQAVPEQRPPEQRKPVEKDKPKKDSGQQ